MALHTEATVLQPWQGVSMPAEVTRVPSMLTAEEKQYLCWLTSDAFEGWGAVVDLGPWLGSSSVALAEGLKRRGGSSAKVHSFDLFSWEPGYMEAIASTGLGTGADFLPLFLDNTAPYARWIEARQQDLSDYRWNGGPIEILFVDAAKTWGLTNAILKGFGEALIPGRTRVVLQDFRHYDTYWLPLIFDSRPDLWQQTEDVLDGWTVTFQLLRPLAGPGGLSPDYCDDAFPLRSFERLLRSRISREDPSNRHWYLRMLYRKYLVEGTDEGAEKLREELMASGSVAGTELAAMADVEHLLVPRAWNAYDRGDYAGAASVARRALRIAKHDPTNSLLALAFALLKLGDREQALAGFRQILHADPHHKVAQLGYAEVRIAEGRLSDAETPVVDAIRAGIGDEPTLRWALCLLDQAWSENDTPDLRVRILQGLSDFYRSSPAFSEFLATEQIKAGQTEEARISLERALRSESDPQRAEKLRVRWYSIAPADANNAGDVTAGALHRPQIPDRPRSARRFTLGQLTSEILHRADQGDFSASEESVLLGLELSAGLNRSLEIHKNRFSAHRYRDLYQCFCAYGGASPTFIEGTTIVDLGCGSLNPFGLLFLLLMLGARRGVAVDLDGVHDWSRATGALGELAADMLVGGSRIIGNHPIAREQMLRNVASFDLEKLLAGDRTGIDPVRLIYRRESVHALSLETNEADLVISNAFLEHIPAVEEAVIELARVTRPGGLGIHVIDCSDHRRYHNPNIHPLQFLSERDKEALAHGSNRLRPIQFATLFEKNGFEVLKLEPFEKIDSEELRSSFVSPFREMEREALAVMIAKLVVRRRS